jgi:hypothetical protein
MEIDSVISTVSLPPPAIHPENDPKDVDKAILASEDHVTKPVLAAGVYVRTDSRKRQGTAQQGEWQSAGRLAVKD